MATTNSVENIVECPLCLEPLEVDDLKFYPCTCGYQICRFCWHRIRTDENELCPACRKEYAENPADFTPLTQEEMIAFKSQKRQRDQQRKNKITENRKHLANVRVVQKNLVFVVGLPPRLADADILKKHEYFGKYGKIHKVVINPSTTYAGVQGPSASAYVTYVCNTDALRAIQSVNNISIDGRLIKTSLGTTKYCSHFMKNQQCPKSDCMYLHELGDPEASFTKEEMHIGKHQEYEKRLHDTLTDSSGNNTNVANVTGNSVNPTSVLSTIKPNDNIKNECLPLAVTSTASTVSSNPVPISKISNHKEAWPSLSESPINNKDITLISNNKQQKKTKHEKCKPEKNSKQKLNRNITNTNSSQTSAINSATTKNTSADFVENISPSAQISNNAKFKADKVKPQQTKSASNRSLNYELNSNDSTKDDVTSSIPDEVINESNISENDSIDVQDTNDIPNICSKYINPIEENLVNSQERKSKNTIKISELPITTNLTINELVEDTASAVRMNDFEFHNENLSDGTGNIEHDKIRFKNENQHMLSNKDSDPTDTFVRLSAFNNSYFSSTPDSSLETTKVDPEFRQTNPHLPDLLNGIDEYQTSRSTSTNDFIQSPLSNMSLDYRRMSPSTLLSQQHISQEVDNVNMMITNMSKFFDFHKNQQSLQGFSMNSRPDGPPAFIDNSRHNIPISEQQIGCFVLPQPHIPQQHEKFSNSPQMQVQKQPFEVTQHLLSNQLPKCGSIDDDLGFDPFTETSKALAELMETESDQRKTTSTINSTLSTDGAITKAQCQPPINLNMHYQSHFFETPQHRTRMPPPGFSHVNDFGLGGVTQIPQNNRKISPFMNVPTSTINSSQSIPLVHGLAWSSNQLSSQQPLNDIQLQQVNPLSGYQHKGYTNNDWTAMDPAILSLRQFSFPQHLSMPQQHQQHDMYMQNLTQQQQSNHGFVAPQPQLPGNVKEQNNPSQQVNSNVQDMLEYLKTRQFV